MSVWTAEEQRQIEERMLAVFKTHMSLEQQRAFIETLWINHAWFHGLEGKAVMKPLGEDSIVAKRVSDAWHVGHLSAEYRRQHGDGK